MKRLRLGLSALAVALVLLGSGCDNKKSSEENLIGTWTWSKLTLKGVTWSALNPSSITPGGTTVITPALFQQFDPNFRLVIALTFNKDKSAVVTLDATIPGQPAQHQSLTGTWSTSGDKLTVSYYDGSRTSTVTFVYEVSSSLLTVEITNQEFRRLLTESGADLSSLTPAMRDIVNGLSATIELTK